MKSIEFGEDELLFKVNFMKINAKISKKQTINPIKCNSNFKYTFVFDIHSAILILLFSAHQFYVIWNHALKNLIVTLKLNYLPIPYYFTIYSN